MVRFHTKKNLETNIVNGHDFISNLAYKKLIVHCGGCRHTRKTMQMRIKQAKMVRISIVNYGVAIFYMHGAIPRALKPFSKAIAAWEELIVAQIRNLRRTEYDSVLQA